MEGGGRWERKRKTRERNFLLNVLPKDKLKYKNNRETDDTVHPKRYTER